MERKNVFCLLHIPLDLIGQGLGSFENPLVSDPLDECHLDFPAVDILVEIEDVNLNGEPITLKGRIETDVGHTSVRLSIDLDLNRIYPVFGIEFVEDLHIGRRYSQ